MTLLTAEADKTSRTKVHNIVEMFLKVNDI